MMSWHVVVCATVIWLCAASREALSVATNGSSCIEAFQCFDGEYPECSNDTAAIADQTIQGRRVYKWIGDVMRAYLSVWACARTVWIGSRQGALLDIDVEDFSQLLTQLVCHHLNRSTTPPLCWIFSHSMNVTSECNRYVHNTAISMILHVLYWPLYMCAVL